eukprot:GSChrysophyteH1.ASY1.ANO1.86.1 assembled CDS
MSREYSSAGAAIDAVRQGVTFKHYCAKNRMGKVDFALASEALKYTTVLRKVLARAEVSSGSLDISSQGMLEVLCYELLIGAKTIRGGGQVKRKLMGCLDALQAGLAAEMAAARAENVEDLLPERVRMAQTLPQYLRINPLQLAALDMSEASVIDDIKRHCAAAYADQHIPHFCFPSQVLLDTQPTGDVVDACAAPGNKTSHIAADKKAQRQACTVYAFDKNSRRAQLLMRRMAAAGASGVQVRCADFLAVDAEEEEQLQAVTALLVDPSCSGSGVLRDVGRAGDEDWSHERLQSLHTFQVQVMQAALSFPLAETVVYSTCSVHAEENEAVVAELLAARPDWDVAAPHRLQSWTRRGWKFDGLTASQSRCLVRCEPEDGLNGFFVALFCRKKDVPRLKYSKPVVATPEEDSHATLPREAKKRKSESTARATSTKQSLSKPLREKASKVARPFKVRKMRR